MSEPVTRKSPRDFRELFTCIVFHGVKDRNGAFFLFVPSENSLVLCAVPQYEDGLSYFVYECRLGLMQPIESAIRAKDLTDLIWSTEGV
jgi:hypothetical protein